MISNSIIEMPEMENQSSEVEHLSAVIIQLQARAEKAEQDLRDYDDTHKWLIMGAKACYRDIWRLMKKNNECVKALNKLERENEKLRMKHKQRFGWLLDKYLRLKGKEANTR